MSLTEHYLTWGGGVWLRENAVAVYALKTKIIGKINHPRCRKVFRAASFFKQHVVYNFAFPRFDLYPIVRLILRNQVCLLEGPFCIFTFRRTLLNYLYSSTLVVVVVAVGGTRWIPSQQRHILSTSFPFEEPRYENHTWGSAHELRRGATWLRF